MAKININNKVAWSGRIVAVQPRIRLTRSFDEHSHRYLGYVLRIDGVLCGPPFMVGTEEPTVNDGPPSDTGVFLIAVGKSAHEKHQFCIGMELSGMSVPVADPRTETAAYYKTSRIIITDKCGGGTAPKGPPFLGVPTELPIYRERQHRRLNPRTYDLKCTTCVWGCRMAVELIVDNWKPWIKKYRYETFCYGPLSCSFYRAGATRKVPGRSGIVYEEEDLADKDLTVYRMPDD